MFPSLAWRRHKCRRAFVLLRECDGFVATLAWSYKVQAGARGKARAQASGKARAQARARGKARAQARVARYVRDHARV